MNQMPMHIDELDAQHDAIFAQTNQLLQLIEDQAELPVIHDIMSELVARTSMHFGFEEAIMEQGAYPQFEHHKRQHMAMITELGLMLERFGAENGSGHLLRDVEFFRHWLHEHIEYSDGQLEAWYASRP